MNEWIPVIAGVCIALPIGSKMELTWFGNAMLSAGITAFILCFTGN